MRCCVAPNMSRKQRCRMPERSATPPPARCANVAISITAVVTWLSASRISVNCRADTGSSRASVCIDIAPHLVAKGAARAELALGSGEIFLEARRAAEFGERARPPRGRVDQRQQLVEDAPPEAQREAGVAQGRHADDADAVKAAALARLERVGRVREFLGHEDVVEPVIDAARAVQTEHVPVAEELRVLRRHDEGERALRRAVLDRDAAGVEIFGVQDAAAIAPAAGEAESLAVADRAALGRAFAGDDRDVLAEDRLARPRAADIRRPIRCRHCMPSAPSRSSRRPRSPPR